MEQWTGFKLGKEYIKAVYCHCAFFNLYAEYIRQNAELDETQAGIKIARRNSNNLRYADDTTLKGEGEEEKENYRAYFFFFHLWQIYVLIHIIIQNKVIL